MAVLLKICHRLHAAHADCDHAHLIVAGLAQNAVDIRVQILRVGKRIEPPVVVIKIGVIGAHGSDRAVHDREFRRTCVLILRRVIRRHCALDKHGRHGIQRVAVRVAGHHTENIQRDIRRGVGKRLEVKRHDRTEQTAERTEHQFRNIRMRRETFCLLRRAFVQPERKRAHAADDKDRGFAAAAGVRVPREGGHDTAQRQTQCENSRKDFFHFSSSSEMDHVRYAVCFGSAAGQRPRPMKSGCAAVQPEQG